MKFLEYDNIRVVVLFLSLSKWQCYFRLYHKLSSSMFLMLGVPAVRGIGCVGAGSEGVPLPETISLIPRWPLPDSRRCVPYRVAPKSQLSAKSSESPSISMFLMLQFFTLTNSDYVVPVRIQSL